MRCGHDHDKYPLAFGETGFRYWDPPTRSVTDKSPLHEKSRYEFAFNDTLKSDSAVKFITLLINQQHHREALHEILKLEFEGNRDDVVLFTNKIICLRALGELERAIFEYAHNCPRGHESNSEILYQLALVEYRLGHHDRAFDISSEALAHCNDDFTKSRVLLLKGLVAAHSNQWLVAENTYLQLYPMDVQETLVQDNLQIALEGALLKDKKPGIAAALSIIPGLGYAYTGHSQTAITSLLVNGLLAFATFSNIQNENYGMALLTGVFNLSFYIGNVHGSAVSARRSNDSQRQKLLNQLKFNSNL